MDLSSATDRFPLDIQRRLMSYMIGEDASLSWSKLLTSRDFDIRDDSGTCYEGPGGALRYSVGQPMGAYSS